MLLCWRVEPTLAVGVVTGRETYLLLFFCFFFFYKSLVREPLDHMGLTVYLNLPGWMILWHWTQGWSNIHGSTFCRFASDQTTCLNSFVFTPAALWLCCSLSCSSLSDLTCSQIHVSLPPRLFPLVFDLCTSDIFSPDLKGRSVSVSAWNHHIWSYNGETCNTRMSLCNIC